MSRPAKPFSRRAPDTVRVRLRRYFFAGLLVTLPLGLTIIVLVALVRFSDRVLRFLPPLVHPDTYLPFHLPGLGLLFTVAILLLVGLLTSNFLGRGLVLTWEIWLGRIPLVRNLYGAIKQLVETLSSSSSGKNFSRVVLLEFPRRGIHCIGFVTSVGTGEVQEKTNQRVLNVFLPTTPNPTSGYLLFVPEDEVIPLKMTVEEGLKLVISGGIVSPPWPPPAAVVPKPSTGR